MTAPMRSLQWASIANRPRQLGRSCPLGRPEHPLRLAAGFVLPASCPAPLVRDDHTSPDKRVRRRVLGRVDVATIIQE